MEALGSAAAAVVLLSAGYYLFVLRSATPQPPHKSGAQKREELTETYRERMRTELSPYRDDPDMLRTQKGRLLSRFSAELSQNIFFTPEEAHGLIRDLAAYDID